MRKRIRQIAKGKFEYDQPSLSISEEELSFTVIEGQEYTGEFEITSENHIPVRGIVYSTHPRMECLTPQFEGEKVRIRYQFHSKGLIEGQEEKGAFVIVCNQSVHSLSFCVSISRLYAQTAMGTVRSLSDFAALARENWDEAYQLFYHKSFPNIFKTTETKESMIYQGILAARPAAQSLEEFLVAAGKKGQIHFSLSQDLYRMGDVTETQQQMLEIHKSEWGWLELSITSDADFIRLPEEHITSADFIGSTYQCRFFVDYERMHAGKNCAKITVSSLYESKSVEVYAHKDETQTSEERDRRKKIRRNEAKLVELYEAYRLKKIVTGVWATESVQVLDQLHAMLPDTAMYPLMKAQALVINRQKQEAEWILDEFKRTWSDHHAPEWGYYLYVMTLMEREPSFVDRMTHEIEQIFRENPDSGLLFWILLFLEEEYYNNSAHKLHAIARFIMHGWTSPYFYLEAYYLVSQDPYLIAKLGRFEVRILQWAIRHGILTKELAERIFESVEVNRGFDPVHYALMRAAYEVNPKPEYVGLVCSYLIRAQKFERAYHHWFEMGIELELRITGLYEAYLLSLDEREVKTVPKIIRMYFQYESNLPYRKMAILYNNIIASKESEPEIYEQYRKVMSRFAMEQIEQAHIDDNLAVVYEDMLDVGFLNKELAHGLAKILFTCKLVLLHKDMTRAIVYQKEMKEPQIVPVVDGCAYVSVFSKDYVVLFEDAKGRRYAGDAWYRLEKLISPEPYLEKCTDLAPDELPYLIFGFSGSAGERAFTSADEKFFPRLLFAEELSAKYQAALCKRIVHYYRTKEEPVVEEYLQQADYSLMPQPIRQYMMEELIERRMYDKAYELVQIYGIDQIGPAAKVALAGYLLSLMPEKEEDEQLLSLCGSAFSSRKYNDGILEYLCAFYTGPVQIMLRLWRTARDFELDTGELEEHILEEMIYADLDLSPVTDLFLHYYENGGQDLIILAALTVYARAFFVKEESVSAQIFELIEKRFRRKMQLNDACKLALLKSYAGQKLTGIKYQIADELLSEYTGRNMNFAFYKKLDKGLVQKYHLYDRVYLEYRTDPRKHVVLHYSRDEDGKQFHKIEMPRVYDGIFVEAFVLFFGEEVQYYITEEYKNNVVSTESSRLTCNDIYAQKDESRYNLLNQMLISETLSEDTEMFRTMKQYAGFDEVTKKVFKMME